jgi:heme a synthase
MPQNPPATAARRWVAAWLFTTAAMVLAMVVVGGATRLTGSGLSITQWKPITGALPPLGEGDWRRLFDLYRATPQFHLINPDMTLEGFKFIFWWEWGHRLLGRSIGVVFALPFVVFLLRGWIPRRLTGRLILLFILGGLQGLVGWWMVKSGLEARVSVAPERLATHLSLALALFVALIWTGLDALDPRPETRGKLVTGTIHLLIALVLQSLLGALVAGGKAGLIDADWPLMGGRWFPEGYAGRGLWETLAHSAPAVQFNHRVFGYLVATAVIAFAFRIGRRRPDLVAPARLLAGLVVLQIMLGIATLWLTVPLGLALAHQANAALAIAAATWLCWRSGARTV